MDSSEHPPRLMPRRLALKWLAAAAAGMALVGRLELNAAQTPTKTGKPIGSDPVLNKDYKAGELWPLVMTPAQRRAAAALADLIVPPEEGGQKPSQLAVHEFIDEWISSPYDQTAKDRPIVLAGLDFVDAEAQKRHQKVFAELSEAQQAGIADAICGATTPAKEYRPHVKFFERFRYLAAGGYFTTPQGMKELGYVGNRPSATFDGPTPEALKHLGLS
jgi:hypothetical protein